MTLTLSCTLFQKEKKKECSVRVFVHHYSIWPHSILALTSENIIVESRDNIEFLYINIFFKLQPTKKKCSKCILLLEEFNKEEQTLIQSNVTRRN